MTDALSLEIARIEALLDAAIERDADGAADFAPVASSGTGPTYRLATKLGLDPFMRDLLLLAASVHLSPRIAPLCARLSGDPQGRVSAAIAMATLPGADWAALRPDAPLRALRCLRLADPDRPTMSELLIDERILLALLGQDAIDERLAPLVAPVGTAGTLPPSALAMADRLAQRWHMMRAQEAAPILQLGHGEGEEADARAIAAEVAARLGRRLFALAPANLPATVAERHGMAALWRREHLLGPVALLLELPPDPAPGDLAIAADLADRLDGLVMVRGAGVLPCRRALMAEVLTRPNPVERHSLWIEGLGHETAARLNGKTEALAEQFELGPSAIARLSGLARGMEAEAAHILLRGEARLAAQTRIAAIAEVIRPAAGWDDIVLPDDLVAILKGMVAQVRHRAAVHDGWGFAAKSSRGLGLAALFAGPSGTGKTLAAEVVARALDTDLVRVDLAGVVSKYIGETEKNLDRVFSAAEGSGAVLLFDEADALFGKRSEVANAHDRYANIEVSYLLQRMESYTGLTVLTTNQREALDHAFFRRLRFVLNFPFPDAATRRAVWAGAFPAETETEPLDFDRLARLNVTPGNIRTIAINAAFMAKADNGPVAMRHLHAAALIECRKLEHPVTAAELGGWQ